MAIFVCSRGKKETDTEISEMLDAIDVETLLDAEGIRYKRTHGSSGAQVNIKECPFCGNEKWKLYANAETGLGKCFVCEEGVNKWKLLKANNPSLSNRDLVELVKRMASEMGWRARRRKAVAVNTESNELKLPASFPIPIKGRNLAYLENRNITVEIAKYFSMRFSMDGEFVYRNEAGRKCIQSYAKRIIIPVFDLQGELVSFQGRDITGTAEKKYLFPPGFSSTGKHLYNGQNAMGVEHIVIGEGVFDVAAIKIAMDGDIHTRDIVPVGSFGKHLSYGEEDSQMAKLTQLKAGGLKTITFMWDGESKAICDAVEAALMCRRQGFIARVAILPKDKDPNEVAPEVVRQAFWKAITIDPITAAQLKLKYA